MLVALPSEQRHCFWPPSILAHPFSTSCSLGKAETPPVMEAENARDLHPGLPCSQSNRHLIRVVPMRPRWEPETQSLRLCGHHTEEVGRGTGTHVSILEDSGAGFKQQWPARSLAGAPSTHGGVSSHWRSQASLQSDFKHCFWLHSLQTKLSDPSRDPGSCSISFNTFPFCFNEQK